MSEQIIRVPIDHLLPWNNAGRGQPRKFFDPQALQELADSMKTGFIGSITVRPFPGRPGYFEILAGHRRHKAAGLAGLAEIPCTVADLSDADARMFVLADNLNRADFLVWEEGAGYAELVEGGMSMADVAAKVGKSPAFVSGRIKIHNGLGETARRLYLRKELTLAALELLASLPDRNLAPVQCPYCRIVGPEGTTVCPGCAKDLSGVFRCESGNVQTVAAQACRGKTNGAVSETVEKVRDAYGIGAKPVQTSLGFTLHEISEGAIQVRTVLERRLADIAAAGDWFAENAAKLAEFTPGQRKAIAAQADVGIKMLTRIREAAVPESPAIALAL